MSSNAHQPTEPDSPLLPAAGAHLVVFLKDGVKLHRLAADRVTTVGRAEDCDVTIDVPSLSRKHFSVRAGTSWLLTDLNGTNGTKLNGQRLAPHTETPIEVGNLIECGGVFFTLRQGAPSRPAETTPPGTAPRGEPPPGVVVNDAAMVRLHELVGMVAKSTLPVLVVGETGVGKEVVSAGIHARSLRAKGPFIRLNCAALPETLLESELFGYERGAFTGASTAKPGLIEAAHGGTLFLDEIGEMPAATQAKLLRVLESGELMRLGSLKPRIVDVRFVAATNRNLPALLASGAFRQDLYFRLNGLTIPIPSLRERPGEIPALAAFFLAQGAARSGRAAPDLPEDVAAVLAAHPWPGNVRELKNVIERALMLSGGGPLRREHVLLDGQAALAPSVEPPAPAREGRILRVSPEEERKLIEEALERAGGNQGEASKLLGISRRTLVNRLNEHGLQRPRKRT